jgi:hypothetical protein
VYTGEPASQHESYAARAIYRRLRGGAFDAVPRDTLLHRKLTHYPSNIVIGLTHAAKDRFWAVIPVPSMTAFGPPAAELTVVPILTHSCLLRAAAFGIQESHAEFGD